MYKHASANVPNSGTIEGWDNFNAIEYNSVPKGNLHGVHVRKKSVTGCCYPIATFHIITLHPTEHCTLLVLDTQHLWTPV